VTSDELKRLDEVRLRLASRATYIAQVALGQIRFNADSALNLVESAQVQLRRAVER
jgi:hypothetical protein